MLKVRVIEETCDYLLEEELQQLFDQEINQTSNGTRVVDLQFSTDSKGMCALIVLQTPTENEDQ